MKTGKLYGVQGQTGKNRTSLFGKFSQINFEFPGRLLEVFGNKNPRGMIDTNRIRLTNHLTLKISLRAIFFARNDGFTDNSMKTLKSLLYSFIFGVLLGGSLSSWLAPRVISWWYNPPAEVPFNCTPAIQWALNRLQISQLWMSLGVGILCTLFWAIAAPGRKRRNKGEPTL